MAGTAGPETLHELRPGSELRLETAPGSSVTLTLKEGEAEVFGTSLTLGEAISISDQKLAVFSWQGAKILVQGEPEIAYTSDDTPMQSYINVHDTLEARRRAASERAAAAAAGLATEGPRVMLVGPTDAGKSSLSKILLNYAVRCGWTPTFVDLDLGQGSITIPGCIGATPVEGPLDIEEGYPSDAPLVYYAASTSGAESVDLYRQLVESMAGVLDRRSALSAKVAASGALVNTMGWIDGDGYALLKHAAGALRCDVILVLGSDRLHSQLVADMPPSVSVVKLAKSGGVVTRSREARAEARKARVEEYFYGPHRTLVPASQTVKLEDVEIYRVGGAPRAPSSALPIGAASVADPLKLVRVTNPQELLYAVLAVSHAPSADLLLSASVAGFVYVQDADPAKGTLTVLAPRPGALPSTRLLAGNFKIYLD